ncbi:unnamed protein product [Spirodela intermedia]|uniref:Uncharacterized protein n=1 Tax=Spirodela intermedia TaxID=51605 RepID=A0A7I8LF08_SPIIN|nr:unnamed protein product [Spirodela intermedia]
MVVSHMLTLIGVFMCFSISVVCSSSH